MALIKRNYIDEETLITAQNLNDIQDAVMALEDGLFTVDDDKSGSVITITDAAKRGFRSFNIYGKTKQNGTPTPEAPVDLVSVGNGGNVTVSVTGKNILPYPYLDATKTIAGITFTVNKDGSVAASGTSTGSINFWFTGYTFKLKKGVTYTMSVGDGFSVTGDPYLWVANNASVILAGINLVNKRTVTFTPTEDINNAAVYIVAGTVGSVFNGTIRPQLEVGSVATPYEMHKEQKLVIATPNGLPGVPVTSGGNYIDESGQRWKCDEIDFYKKKRYQRITKASGMTWAVAENDGYPVGDSLLFRRSFTTELGSTEIRHRAALCNKLPYNQLCYNNNINGFYFSFGTVYARIQGVSDAATFNSLMAGAEIVFELDNTIESTVDSDVIAAYEAVHTNKENTTVFNADMAYMELEYVMDAKKYIDGILKLDEAARYVDISLPASKWVGTGSLYSQVVSLYGITAHSQVNLTPTVQQMTVFYEKDISFITENDGGVVTIYVIGQKPQNDYTIPAKIVEVRV